MFVGHYAASFALKSIEKRASLGLLFIAAQFVDILFFSLTLGGVEKFKVVENYTESTHFQLIFMPYTHSLLSTFIWGGVIFITAYYLYFKRMPNSKNISIVMATAVISHWFFDLIMHTPDLPLISDDSIKMGLSLWNNAYLSYLLEAVFLLASLYLYMKATSGKTMFAKIGAPLFVIFLLAANVLNIFGPLSPDDNELSVALSALAAYGVFAVIAFYLDKMRT